MNEIEFVNLWKRKLLIVLVRTLMTWKGNIKRIFYVLWFVWMENDGNDDVVSIKESLFCCTKLEKKQCLLSKAFNKY